MTRHFQRRAGFTLIEFLVVATLMVILSTIGMVGYSSVSRTTRDKQRQKDMEVIRVAMEQYYELYGNYPTAATMTDLTSNPEFAELLQSGSQIRDPLNTGSYQYAVSSSANTFQLTYTEETTGIQRTVNNLSKAP